MVGVYQDGPFRSSVALWVQTQRTLEIKSWDHLVRLVQDWDGNYPDAAKWNTAKNRAQAKATKLVQEAAVMARKRDRENAAHQVEAARLRLMGELGRFLICIAGTSDDLNTVFHEHMARDIAGARRLTRCYEKLGGYPEWPETLRHDLNAFHADLTPNRIKARLIGSELDAALQDPRWAVD